MKYINMTYIRGKLTECYDNFRWRCQRFRRGYSSIDVWEMRTWFVNTIKAMLEDLLIHHTGYPSELTNEEWEAVLAEMIDLLTVMDIWDDTGAKRRIGIKDPQATELNEPKISEEKARAKKRFFELFDKWFYDLWD